MIGCGHETVPFPGFTPVGQMGVAFRFQFRPGVAMRALRTNLLRSRSGAPNRAWSSSRHPRRMRFRSVIASKDFHNLAGIPFPGNASQRAVSRSALPPRPQVRHGAILLRRGRNRAGVPAPQGSCAAKSESSCFCIASI